MNKKFLLFLSLIVLFTALSALDPVASTIKTSGAVELTRNQNLYEIASGTSLFNDDQIHCKKDAYAAIRFSDNSSLVKIFPNSVLVIHANKANGQQNKKNLLKMGELWSKIDKNSGTFEVETPTTVASVKGTGFLLTVDENGLTDLYTVDGTVEFTNKFDGLKANVTAGNHASSNGQGQIMVQPFELSDLPDNIVDFIQEAEPETAPQSPEGSSAPAMPRPSPSSIEMPEAPEETEESASGGSFGLAPLSMGGGIGTVSSGDDYYTQIRLLPELRFGKFGLGLDLEIMIDNEGNIRESDWDEWQDYVNKLYYLRYGYRGDKIYGRIGSIPSYTLGHGLIMKNYTNMLHYPETKQIGLQLGGQIPIMDMQAEIFTSNVTKNEILAGRVTLAPLQTQALPILKNIRFGTTIAHDTNQINGLKDKDGDGYPDAFDDFPNDADWHDEVDYNTDYYQDLYEEIFGSLDDFEQWFENSEILERNPSFDDLTAEFGTKDVTIIGLDYELPLLSNKLLSLGHYAEVAKFADSDSDKGAGFIFPGFYSKFLIFQMNLEYRQYQAEFIPGFFDRIYDDQRATAYTSPENQVVTKYDRISEYNAARGWYGSITSNILRILYLTIAYEDMYSEDISNKSLWGNLSLDKSLIPRLNSAEINYMQRGFDSIAKLQIKNENAFVEGILGYGISANTELKLNYRIQFVDLDNSGSIDSEEETITSMSMGVEFRF
ncbi:MAG: FecR family protein [Candidatus Cloacimonadales bacterium]